LASLTLSLFQGARAADLASICALYRDSLLRPEVREYLSLATPCNRSIKTENGKVRGHWYDDTG